MSKYERIRLYYLKGYYNDQQLNEFVGAGWITIDEAYEIRAAKGVE